MKRIIYILATVTILSNLVLLSAVYFYKPIDVSSMLNKILEQEATIKRKDAYISYLEDMWNAEKQVSNQLWKAIPDSEIDRLSKFDEEVIGRVSEGHNFKDWVEPSHPIDLLR